MKLKHTISAASVAFALISTPAIAQVAVTFSGGGGSPLSITLPEVSWTITDAATFNSDGAGFGIGIAVNQTPGSVSYGNTSTGGNIADWSSDGSTTFTFALPGSFYANNNFGGLNDGGIVWTGLFKGGSAADGDIITYAGGTFGSSANISETFTAGEYDVFLISTSGSVVGEVVPEPATYAFLLGFAALGLVAVRRRRRNA